MQKRINGYLVFLAGIPAIQQSRNSPQRIACCARFHVGIHLKNMPYAVEQPMQDLDKPLVFYVNVLGMTVFLLIIFYFYITAKPKDAVD